VAEEHSLWASRGEGEANAGGGLDKRAYRLADNQLADRGSWDLDLLRTEIQDLGFADFDLGLIGFEPDRLEDILSRRSRNQTG
jgi:hypothetical protein